MRTSPRIEEATKTEPPAGAGAPTCRPTSAAAPTAGRGGDRRPARHLAPTGSLLITFAVDVDQAERIVFAAEHGSRLATLPEPGRPTSEDGSRPRTAGNIYDD